MKIRKNRYKNSVSCIYKIEIKNYIYIGSTSIFKKRKYEHFWKLKKNIHPNQILQNIFNKYGENKFVFSIIEEIEVDKLIQIEQKYIDLYNNNDNFRLINILTTAGSSLGYICSEETREKKRISMLGKNKGNKRNNDFCLEQSKRQKGRIITEEWKRKISSSLKGRKSPNKSKRFIEFGDIRYTFREFSEMVNCDISTLYTTKKEYTEKKYNCKIIIKQDFEVLLST